MEMWQDYQRAMQSWYQQAFLGLQGMQGMAGMRQMAALQGMAAAAAALPAAAAEPRELEAGTFSGVVKQNAGRYGFILQDGTDSDMFFMPIQCEAFGGVCPPVGTRVLYEVGQDAKTSKPRAENIRPDPVGAAAWAARQQAADATPAPGQAQLGHQQGGFGPQSGCHGVVKLNSGNFGFIRQDSGESDMFLMPGQCLDFGGAIPPVGTRVVYDISADPKTGKLRAESVCLEPGSAQPDPVADNPGPANLGALMRGTVKQNSGRFGFIVPDEEKSDMFVMPLQCTGFGGECPPVGTRVIYKVGQDPKSGRPRAEDVQPEDPFWQAGGGDFSEYAAAAAGCAAAAQSFASGGFGPARTARNDAHSSQFALPYGRFPWG